MRFGLVGAGRIGENHARILAATEGVERLLVADVVDERAAAVAATLPLAEHAAVDTLVQDVDALVIASSTNTHAALLETAAEAGLPAFCEKPIALDLESSGRAVAAVDAAGITVQMGFQRRYDPAMRSIRDRVASGEIGRPYLVRSQTYDPAPPPVEYLKVSGGIFRDCLIHDIDIVRYVTGQEVEAVTAAGASVGFPEIGRLGDVDTATALLHLSEGTIGQLSALRHDPVGYDVRLEVFAPHASLAAGWNERSPIVSADPGALPPADPITTFWDRFDAAFRIEMNAFVRVVRGEEAPASTHHDAHQDLRVAAACDLSLAEGRTVSLKEIT